MEEAAFSTDLMVLAYIPDSTVGQIKLVWGIAEFRDDDVNNDVKRSDLNLVYCKRPKVKYEEHWRIIGQQPLIIRRDMSDDRRKTRATIGA